MRKYKLVIIFKRALDKKISDEILAEAKRLAGDLKNEKMTDMGEKKFAYKVKNEQSGNYLIWEFEADTIVPEMEIRLKNNDNVLRHLLVRVD